MNHIKEGNNEDQIEKITPLIKIVKQREELYLLLMNFVSKNIESSSNQHQQLTVFSKYLGFLETEEREILLMENAIVSWFEEEDDEEESSEKVWTMIKQTVTKTSKQILRLCSRLLEILDTSVAKSRHSIFNESGCLTLQFNRFKRQLHNIIKGDTVDLAMFVKSVINFTKLKYKKQLAKVQKYVYQLQDGATVALKELYLKDKTDQEDHQSDSKENFYKTERNKIKIEDFKVQHEDKVQHGSGSESPKKPIKRPSLTKAGTKKGHKLFKTPKKQVLPVAQTNPKQLTANKLFKHYNMLELSKKQFFQDMIYDQLQEEEHKRKLMNSLLERNKTIQGQISMYYKRAIVYKQMIDKQNLLLLSSGEEKETKQKITGDDVVQQSMPKTTNMRKSFVISKRKSSLNFQKNSKIFTQNDESFKGDIFIKTVKNLQVRRKSAIETSHRQFSNKSKKLFVIKSPVVFQDDVIPQAPKPQISKGGQGWFRPPLTARKPQKKNENIRLKRRNNPLPIQSSFFNQNFKFTENLHF